MEMSVLPIGDHLPPAPPARRSLLLRGLSVSGFVYLIVTVCLNVRYIDTMQLSAANDYYWAGFNSTGAQTFVADVFNSKLQLTKQGPVLFNSSIAIAKSYALSNTVIHMNPSSARATLYDNLPLLEAIAMIRRATFDSILTMPSPLCWVDFNRTFGLAITARRQRRCEVSDAANAAVYLDALFRQTRMVDVTRANSYRDLNASVFAPLRTTPAGAAWMAAFETWAPLPVDDEATAWTRAGLTQWRFQPSNAFQVGLEETISITNAMGLAYNVKVTTIPTLNRGSNAWATVKAYFGTVNILYVCALFRCSFVRDMPNSIDRMPFDWDVYVMVGPRRTPTINLVRSSIGPFGSIDIRYIAPPPVLIDYALAFHNYVLPAIQNANDATIALFHQVDEPQLDPIPASWTAAANMLFYGGNPMCIFGSPQSAPVQSFAFDDSCGGQVPHTVRLTKLSTLFAVTVVKSLDIPATCGLCRTTSALCTSALQAISAIHKSASAVSAPPVVQSAVRDAVTKLNMTFIQFATQNGSDVLLVQPMVPAIASDPWTLYGWIAIHDWLQGNRELFTIEGDVGTYSTLSPLQPSIALPANPLELPQNACYYVWYIIVYMTAALAAVAFLMLLFGAYIGFDVPGSSLFVFNRVVGSVWIGRPFLVIRGMTAMVILSTANVNFFSPGGFSQLRLEPRPWLDVLLLAGETNWVSYAITDVLLPFTGRYTTIYSPLSSVASWLIVATWEFTAPCEAQAMIQQTCTIPAYTRATCTSGSISIGSPNRLLSLCIVHGACLLVSFLVSVVYVHATARLQSSRHVHHLLIPAAAEAYLIGHTNAALRLDKVSCVMAGMIPVMPLMFDLKLWGAIPMQHALTNPNEFEFAHPDFKRKGSGDDLTTELKKPVRGAKWLRASAVFGLGYIVATVVGSYIYLGLTQSTMANDFWWEGFNTSGTQPYVCNWLNVQLQLMTRSPPFKFDQPQDGQTFVRYNGTTGVVEGSTLYGSLIQNEASTLSSVIHGLRKMDGCQLPWIATAYCYVNFNRQWEMANTANKQARCAANEKSNGAVYLEAILRNADWASLDKCWGRALQMAVFSYVETTSTGKEWLAGVRGNTKSVASEVEYWTASGISVFRTQWQNYKTIGVIETFDIRNAFGISYPLTLKSTNGSFQIGNQLTFKMYWAFSNDLTAIMTNTSVLGGLSLVRQSPLFAFTNSTTGLEPAIVQAGYLASPAPPSLAIIREFLGPFGSIDLKLIACPQSVKNLQHQLTRSVTSLLLTDSITATTNLSKVPRSTQLSVQPQAWDVLWMVGGNIFCEPGTKTANEINEFFTVNSFCGTTVVNRILASAESFFKGMIASRWVEKDATDAAIVAACQRETRNKPSCLLALRALYPILHQLHSAVVPGGLVDLVEAAKRDIRDRLQVSVIQTVRYPNNSLALSVVNVLDPVEVNYEVWGWLYLLDWVDGRREVIQLEGERGSLTTISGQVFFQTVPPNALEVPFNVAYYIRTAIQYVTIVLLLVACVVVGYIFSMRGYIECWNMFEFNRVAGMVWIGRPLVFLRGITAICLLSTTRLDMVLSSNAIVTHMTSPPRYWVTTFMSCGEMAWLVYILNDVFSPLTKQFTHSYSYKSVNLVWLITFVWSMAAPPEHKVTINRDCSYDVVDFQLVCRSGLLEIGSVTRFGGLIGLAFGCCLVCYLLERVVYPRLQFRLATHSLMLHAAARDNLDFDRWTHRNVYYLDKASAVLNGILSVQVGHVIHIFDVKSWRQYDIDVSIEHHNSLSDKDGARQHYLGRAIPLVE